MDKMTTFIKLKFIKSLIFVVFATNLSAQSIKVSHIGDTLIFNSWTVDLDKSEPIPNIEELKAKEDPNNEQVIIVKSAKIGEFSIYYRYHSEWGGDLVDTFEITNLFELVDIHLDSDGDIDYDRTGEETKEEYYFMGLYVIYFPIDKLTELIAKNKTNTVVRKYWDAFEQNVEIRSISILEGEDTYRFLSHGKLVSLPAYKIKKTITIPVFLEKTGTFYNNGSEPSVYVIPNSGNTTVVNCRCEKIMTIESKYWVNKNVADPVLFDQETYMKLAVRSKSADKRCQSVCEQRMSSEIPYARMRLRKIK